MADRMQINYESVRGRISRARDLAETRNFLLEMLALSDGQILQLFGIGGCAPQEIHGMRDQIFTGLIGELVQNGWNYDTAAFGASRRDSFLMEMARRGYARSVSYMLRLGADANYNSHGYGDSTALMAARDTSIMEALLTNDANPLEVNALNQTDFTYKLLSGAEAAAKFYVTYSERLPFQALLKNFRECILNRNTVPYASMYPLCPVPVFTEGGRFQNILDKALVDAMIENRYLPFSTRALTFPIRIKGEPEPEVVTVWQYIRSKIRESQNMYPSLLVALMTCMSKSPAFQTLSDFAMLEQYITKPVPRTVTGFIRTIAKAPFVYMLFALGSLPPGSLLRWLMLLGKTIRNVALWMDILGEEPFRVSMNLQGQEVTPIRPGQARSSHVLQELSVIQSLLAMRVNVPDSFGEFAIPENFGL